MKEAEPRAPSPGRGAGGDGEIVQFGYHKVQAAEKGTLVRQHFDRVAPTYDLGNTVLSLGLHHLWKRTAVRMLGLRPGEQVLDLCGGTADLSLIAGRAVGAGGRIVLCDINLAMMQAGKPKARRAGLGDSISWVQADAERLSFPDEAFDAAMVGFGIRNLTHMERGFEEMHRVLKPGGRLLCLEFSKPTNPLFRRLYDLYSFVLMPILSKALVGQRESYLYLAESIRVFPGPEELKRILERIGFSRVGYRGLTNGIAVIHVGVKRESPEHR